MYKTFSTFSIYVFAMTIKFHKLSDITDPYVTNMLYNIFCIHLNIFKKWKKNACNTENRFKDNITYLIKQKGSLKITF